MTATLVLALFGLLLGLAGSVVLAISLNGVIAALSLATDAHDVAIEGLLSPTSPIVRFTGTDTHVTQGRKSSGRLVELGLWLLVLSFLF